MRSNLPSRAEAWQRLRRAAPPEWVLRHCRTVEALAVAMADAARRHHPIDVDLVARGALLHDIGRSITQDVRHAGLGADLLRADHFPESLAAVVERHTGAGIPLEEAARLGLPARDYMPRSLEEKIVAHADNLISGDKRISLADVEAKYLAKGLDPAWRRIEALHRELAAVLDVDIETISPARLPDP